MPSSQGSSASASASSRNTIRRCAAFNDVSAVSHPAKSDGSIFTPKIPSALILTRNAIRANAIDVTVVCEDPVGRDDARIPGHHVDPAVRVAWGAEAYFALSMDGGFRADSGRSRGHPCRTGLRPGEPRLTARS